MRLLILALLLSFVVLGAAFAALNDALVHYDFLLFQAELPRGVALLGALVLGWLLGGLSAWLGRAGTRRRLPRDGQDGA